MKVKFPNHVIPWLVASECTKEDVNQVLRHPDASEWAVFVGPEGAGLTRFAIKRDHGSTVFCVASGLGTKRLTNSEFSARELHVRFCVRLPGVEVQNSSDCLRAISKLFGVSVDLKSGDNWDAIHGPASRRMSLLAPPETPRDQIEDLPEYGFTIKAYREWLHRDIMRIREQPAVSAAIDHSSSTVLSDHQKLLLRCAEFEELLDGNDTTEREIQRFLKQRENWVFLSQNAERVDDEVELFDRKADFVVVLPSQRYRVIEIEDTSRIFNLLRKDGTGADPSWRYNHARQQIRDWKSNIQDYRQSIADKANLPGLLNPTGVIVMGRHKDIDSEIAQKRWRALQSEKDPVSLNYDDLLADVRSLADLLKKLN